ncbi:MAG: [FeFe] hydrogenase H-cluster maturation GTPase HydF [Oscillospiraceae bacterium]
MSLNTTPSGERIHIAFFGCRNAGKSSVVNAVTSQKLAVVSDVAGTTTDPVYKSMELLPLGPVMIIDTPGFDDVGKLGELRIEKTKQVLNKTDIAVIVVNCETGITSVDNQLIELVKERELPYIIAYNKCDLIEKHADTKENEIYISAKENLNIYELKEKIGTLAHTDQEPRHLIADMVEKYGFYVLVVPIDSAAPKGRLILPQQQVIRDILEAGGIPIVTRETELEKTLQNLDTTPKMVITDSQAFKIVSKIVPASIPLTSFSILMARYKGFLKTAVEGAKYIDKLQDGDKILIAEGCTHHRQCEDIGTVKLPKLLHKYTGKSFELEFSSGTAFPEDLEKYQLIIHCGGCMLNEKEMQHRRKSAENKAIPFTNYGTAIAYMNGILERSLGIFVSL